MNADKLNGWEKAALFTTGAGGAFNILLYQLGYSLADATDGGPPALWLSRVFFALVSFIGFDLTLVVTVMAMRAGRRSLWAWLTVAAAALAAAGIALDVAAVVALPVLHAAPVAVLAVFMLHLAAPRVAHRAEVLSRHLAHTQADLAQAAQARDEAAQEAARAWETVAHARAELAQERDGLAQSAAEADHWRAMAAQAAARPALTADHDTVQVGQRPVSLRALARALDMPKTSVGRAVARAAQIAEEG